MKFRYNNIINIINKINKAQYESTLNTYWVCVTRVCLHAQNYECNCKLFLYINIYIDGRNQTSLITYKNYVLNLFSKRSFLDISYSFKDFFLQVVIFHFEASGLHLISLLAASTREKEPSKEKFLEAAQTDFLFICTNFDLIPPLSMFESILLRLPCVDQFSRINGTGVNRSGF